MSLPQPKTDALEARLNQSITDCLPNATLHHRSMKNQRKKPQHHQSQQSGQYPDRAARNINNGVKPLDPL